MSHPSYIQKPIFHRNTSRYIRDNIPTGCQRCRTKRRRRRRRRRLAFTYEKRHTPGSLVAFLSRPVPVADSQDRPLPRSSTMEIALYALLSNFATYARPSINPFSFCLRQSFPPFPCACRILVFGCVLRIGRRTSGF